MSQYGCARTRKSAARIWAGKGSSRRAASERSPRLEPWEKDKQTQAPEGRQKEFPKLHREQSSVAPPGLIPFPTAHPRLTPRATIYRTSGAERNRQTSSGLGRSLDGRSPFEIRRLTLRSATGPAQRASPTSFGFQVDQSLVTSTATIHRACQRRRKGVALYGGRLELRTRWRPGRPRSG